MADNYQFLDAYGSVLTAAAKDVGGAYQPLVQVAGSVIAIQSGVYITSVSGALTISSMLGTYVEDTAHADGAPGLFTLRVRNDNVASFASANLDYAPSAVDSAGRTLVKPFSSDQAAVRGTGSVNGAASVAVLAAAGTGLKNYVTDVFVANTGAAATLVSFTDGDGSVLGKTIAPAGSGSNLQGLQIPLVTSANQPFNIVAATATSVLHATALGYKAP